MKGSHRGKVQSFQKGFLEILVGANEKLEELHGDISLYVICVCIYKPNSCGSKLNLGSSYFSFIYFHTQTAKPIVRDLRLWRVEQAPVRDQS